MNKRNITLFGLGILFSCSLLGQTETKEFTKSIAKKNILKLAETSYGIAPQMNKAFENTPSEFLERDFLEHQADIFYHIGRGLALQHINNFLDQYPSAPKGNILSLHRAAILMKEKEFYRARHTLENIDGTALSQEELSEWKVRLAYSLLKTQGQTQDLSPLFQDAENSKSYWGKMATLYLAGEELAQKKFESAKNKYLYLLDDIDFAGEAFAGLATIHYLQRDYQKALQLIESIKDYNLKNSSPNTLLQVAGNAYYRIGNREKAIENLSLLQKADEKALLPEDWLILGTALMEKGELEASIPALLKASCSSDITADIAHIYLGRVRRDLGKYAESIASYEGATKTSTPSNIREAAMYEMALVMRSSGQSNFGQDVRIAEQFLLQFPHSEHIPTMEKFLTEFYLSNTDYANSWASIQKIRRKSYTIRQAKQFVLNHLALESLQKEQFAQAQEWIKLALQEKIAPSFTSESKLIQSEIFMAQRDYPSAIHCLKEALFTKGLKEVNRTELLYRLGYALYNNKNYTEAKEYFLDFMNKKQGNNTKRSDAENRLADCLYSLGELKGALMGYQRSLKLQANNNNYALYRSAEILGLQKEYQQQIEVLNTLIINNPKNALTSKAMLEKGRALLLSQQIKEAETIFRQTYQDFKDTENGRQAQLQLALLYYNHAQTDKALESYSQLMQDFPLSQEASSAFDNLKKICVEEGRLDYIEKIQNENKENFALSNDEARTLMFQTAQSEYEKSSPKASQSLTYFIEKYKSGNDVLNAKVNLANLFFKTNQNKALELYLDIINKKSELNHKQLITTLNRLGFLQKKNQNYKKAFENYKELYIVASELGQRRKALSNAVEMAYKTELYKEVTLLSEKAFSEIGKQKLEKARLLYAHSLVQNQNLKEALKEYQSLAQNTDTAIGAEAFVNSILLQKEDKNQDKVTQLLDKFINKGTPQQYWLARAFLLRAEMFQKAGDSISADQYLQSLKENYPITDDGILELIEEKLQKSKNK